MNIEFCKALMKIVPGILLAGAITAAEQPSGDSPPSTSRPSLRFVAAENGEFHFDTGVVRGKLRAGGKSMGLQSVFHVATGKRLDRSNGLFSHYRVFANGKRYGGGAWDWPSQANLRNDGSVEVTWPSAEERPFEMRAVYRWTRPSILDLETTVKAGSDLTGFESFLATYLNESFTNAAINAKPIISTGHPPGFCPAKASFGPWQMFPRDASVVPLIKDGRWQLPPNPVDWTVMPELERPVAYRKNLASGLTVAFMSPPSDCFAIATPHQTESHYSTYLSLFGRNLKAGETVAAKARLIISITQSEQEVLDYYTGYLADLKR